MSFSFLSRLRPQLGGLQYFLTALIVLAMLVIPASGWADGDLVNPGFELSGGSLAGWQVFGNATGNVGVSPTTPRSGSWVASVSGWATGGMGTTYSGMTQGLATSPGAVWTATAYFRHNPDSRLRGENQLVMKVEFYRSFGGIYGTADFISETVITALDAVTPRGEWHMVSLGALAPPDTVEARLAFVFIEEDSAAGTVIIDDVSFSSSGGEPGSDETVAWSLYWHDEFDGVTVDQSKWIVLDEHLIKNNELQYYDPEDVYLENGYLVLRSRRHDPPVTRPHPNGNTAEFEFTSGLVETPGLFSHTYGWIEIRAKLPSTQGIWPAHWMLGENFNQIGWPRCGEIDIMEFLGHDFDTVYFTRHWGDPYEHRGTSFSGPDFSQDFHTFALHWTIDEMYWYVDGSLRFRTSTNDAGDIFQKPFYLILNTAVGGNWPGYPDETTVFPQYHEIDYVRWYVESDPGDFDLDGDVDSDDQEAFIACFGGSDRAWDDPTCRFFDHDADNDIDCDDWVSFTRHWDNPPSTKPVYSACRAGQARQVPEVAKD